ncbi:hypothetical protein BJ508DRAFT_338031 [Ascobolus immersus RN42]|uniref:Uncharacterized protein n=1 Tax=Ascobolus immersus RN42 TaxID=1160509 RepID=A0A3N4HQP4_ASCIM|nr:hypothetical protein BJ508DRAFT_338031 [Ascobolus immersus RN42]
MRSNERNLSIGAALVAKFRPMVRQAMPSAGCLRAESPFLKNTHRFTRVRARSAFTLAKGHHYFTMLESKTRSDISRLDPQAGLDPTGCDEWTYDLTAIRAYHENHLEHLSKAITNLAEVDIALNAVIATGEFELMKAKGRDHRDPKLEARLASAIKNFIVIKRKGEKTLAEYKVDKENVEGCLEIVGLFEKMKGCMENGDEEGGRMLLFKAMGSGKGLL